MGLRYLFSKIIHADLFDPCRTGRLRTIAATVHDGFAAEPGVAVKRWHQVNTSSRTGHPALHGAVLRAMLEMAATGHQPRTDHNTCHVVSGAQHIGSVPVS